MDVAIIGGGLFGTMTALRLAEMGQSVALFERRSDVILGASYNNQNRLHLGFHYPRDAVTAAQCARGFRLFKDEFPDCILGGFPNAYFIAETGSMTLPSEFLSFCRRHRLDHEVLDVDAFSPAVRNVCLGVLTQEVVYDCALLRAEVKRRLRASGVNMRLNHEVDGIARRQDEFVLWSNGQRELHARCVVNCSYADINRLTAMLGHAVEPRQFEYTVVAIIEFDWPEPVGITVMDGKFMTLLPFGKTGRYLLYHVHHVAVATEIAAIMSPDWRDEATSPFATLDKEQWFKAQLASCCEFVPALRSARLVGFLKGPRMVLAHREETDARPSFVTAWEPGYLTVMAGKVDCATWIADEVADTLARQGVLSALRVQ